MFKKPETSSRMCAYHRDVFPGLALPNRHRRAVDGGHVTVAGSHVERFDLNEHIAWADALQLKVAVLIALCLRRDVAVVARVCGDDAHALVRHRFAGAVDDFAL